MLHQFHVVAHFPSRCKRERSIASPAILFYLAASLYPLLTSAGQRSFFPSFVNFSSLLVAGSVRSCRQSCVLFFLPHQSRSVAKVPEPCDFYHRAWILNHPLQDATAFQAEVVAILDCVASCLRKVLVNEQITICTDSQAAVAVLAASGTKSLLVADCIKKHTVLSEVNQVTIIWVPWYSGIQQNETADKLVREGAKIRPIGPEPFLPLSLSRFKSKMRNWD